MGNNHSNLNSITCTSYMKHPAYEVTNLCGDNVGVNILFLYYGRLWEMAMHSLDHQMDGYMFTIQHMGESFKIYRKVEIKKERHYNQLRVVK